jgi:hypothetical protein
VENAFIEAFDGRLGDECLNVHQFTSSSMRKRKSKPGASIKISADRTARPGISHRTSTLRKHQEQVV